MKRVPYETMVNEFKRVLVKKGFTAVSYTHLDVYKRQVIS